jgi:hypothetical protein
MNRAARRDVLQAYEDFFAAFDHLGQGTVRIEEQV